MLSVIIPIYNGEKYIKETIENILKGEYQDLEIIAVVDGSNDSSYDICMEMAKTDDRIKVFYKENGGIAETRNYGIARANGEYFCVCDQDDVVQPKMYSLLIESIRANDADCGFCSNGQLVGEEVVPLETFDNATLTGEGILQEILYPMVLNGYNIPVKMTMDNRYPNIWKAVIKRSFWNENHIDFHSYVSYEDDLMAIVRMLSVAKCVTTVKYCGYLWRINLGSESHAKKYVDSIGEKQQLWLEDISESVGNLDIDKKTKRMIRCVVNCQLYVFAVLNLCSPQSKGKNRSIRAYFEENIYNREFEKSIVAAKYAQKKYPMQYVLTKLLKTKHTYLTYFSARFLVFVLDVVLNNKLLVKLDKMIKGR